MLEVTGEARPFSSEKLDMMNSRSSMFKQSQNYLNVANSKEYLKKGPNGVEEGKLDLSLISRDIKSNLGSED